MGSAPEHRDDGEERDRLVQLLEQHMISRRELLRRSGLVVGSVALAGVAAACGSSGTSETTGEATTVAGTTAPTAAAAATTAAAAVSPGTVNMLGWQGYDDEVGRKAFEDAGGKLQVTYIGNNDEILTKLRGGGLGTFDVVTPNAAFLPALVAADVLQPLDYSKLPNTDGYFKDFYKPAWNTFDGQTWGAPVAWGDAPMVYRPDLVTSVPTSWLDLANPEFKGRVGMWDDGFGHIVTWSKSLGFDPPNQITSAQLEQVVTELKKTRANARVVAPSLGDLGDILARGEAWITTPSWEGVATFVQDKGEQAKWTVPKEGSWGWNDHYCIPKDAPNVDGAYAFINTMISPPASASIATVFVSGTPVEAAVPLLKGPATTVFDYSDVGATLASLGFYALPPFEKNGDITTMDDWNAAWEDIKG
jgi:spermidine/putrescine transport system substrate-binding protein